MKNHLLRRILSMLLVVALLAGYYVPGARAASTGLHWEETDRKIKVERNNPKVGDYEETGYGPTDIVRVSIVLEEKSTVQAGFATRDIAQNDRALAYSRQLRTKQDTLAQAISAQALGGQPLDVAWNLTLVGNIISANVPYGKIAAIARVKGVRDVFVENTYEPCVVEREENTAQPQMFSSLGMVGSTQLWSNGYTGAGSRIAILDTGTDTNHQSLDNGAFLYALQQNAQAAGLSYSDYVKKLELLDTAEISRVLKDLNVYEKIGSLSASKLYLNEKLPFAANYIDKNFDVGHTNDNQSEHGSHVAGIAAANRFIPRNGGYADALETVLMAGMAPDAQLLTMKIFGANGGPTDADYLAAVEDAILLGCDSVNLSLGTSMADTGFHPYYQDMLNYMTTTDTVVVASAGNSGAWPQASLFGYLYSDDVNLDTVGSPGSYSSFFTVASVDNDGGVGNAFRVAGNNVAYADSAENGYCYYLTSLDRSSDGTGTEYDYVFIDGLGETADYKGMDLKGKIVFCSRGGLNFGVKANNAVALGAAAVVIYNNTDEGLFGMNLSDYRYYAPCVSITQTDADMIRAASTRQTTPEGLSYYSGRMTVRSQMAGVNYNSKYYTMSSFSSWGVPGDLTLKPEITAPGGMIYSINGEHYYYGSYSGGFDQYELMSGTSMAAPAVSGMAALLSQYIRDKDFAKQEGMKVRTLAQSLLMSTAVPMYEENSGGNYYSLLNQGAGLARVDLATAASSYILVDNQPDGKVKAELGDDPNRTGVYEFSFSINNLNGKAEDYVLSADLFCQDNFEYQPGSQVYLLDYWTKNLAAVPTFRVNGREIVSGDLSGCDLNSDGAVNADDADYLLEYLLGNETVIYGQTDVNGDGAVNTYDAHVLLAMLENPDGFVTVPANGSVTVDVKLALTAESKAMLDAQYENGTYVEAFVYAEAIPGAEGVAGTVHSIPVLAFYGNWSDSTMFDRGTAVELLHGNMEQLPYLYNQIGCGNGVSIDYGDGDEYYFGGNPILQDDVYLPERNAFNSEDSSRLVAQYYSLIRLAADMDLEIRNADTGEVYFTRDLGMNYPAYYHVNMGAWQDMQQRDVLSWTGRGADGRPLPEGTNVEVVLRAVPEYYRNADGSFNVRELGEGAYMRTRMTIDNTAPEIQDMEQVDTALRVVAQDNEYVAAVMLTNANGTAVLASATPNQTRKGAQITLNLDLAQVMGKNFLLAVYDYAGNSTTYEITLDTKPVDRPRFTAVDYQNATYYGLDENGTVMPLITSDRGTVNAVEFVDGYVFEITDSRNLYVAPEDDLYNFVYLRNIDPDDTHGITQFLDLAYNYRDNKLYGIFESYSSDSDYPVLCSIDTGDGTMTVLGNLPVDGENLAIDGDGNFYSTASRSQVLYRYTLADVKAGRATHVMARYSDFTSSLTSLSWDHKENVLYQAFPYKLLKIDADKLSVTCVQTNDIPVLVGLHIRPETWGDRFAPVNRVSSVTLDTTENRTLVGHSVGLKAQVWPWNAADRSVTWSSSNPAVATVDENGVVTGLTVGTAVITAASRLDPGKKATCTVQVQTLNREIRGVMWDEVGDIWWSQFNTDTLPAVTKLAQAADNVPFVATAMADDILYASTLDFASGTSGLYVVNPKTFEQTQKGTSSYYYVDLAYAPFADCLIAPYQDYLFTVNRNNGDVEDIWNWSNDLAGNLVGITYYGTEYNHDRDSYVDYFLLLDDQGNVYLEGFISSVIDAKQEVWYINGPEYGYIGNIGQPVDTAYFQGFYYDGEYVYWNRYNEQDDVVELIVWDCDNSGESYRMGTFPLGVWPVSGLYTDSGSRTAGPLCSCYNQGTLHCTAVPVENVQIKQEVLPAGGLNAVSGNAVAPRSSGEYAEAEEQITVELTNVGTAPNGMMTVTYDPEAMSFAGIDGRADAFAYTVQEGRITVAFATAAELPLETVIATLRFDARKSGQHTITVTHTEAWDEPSGKQEILTVEVPDCEHVYEEGKCVHCGEADPYYVKWYSGTTSLNGTIDLNMYVLLGEKLVNDPNTFVRFTFQNRIVDVPMADALYAPLANYPNRYRFSCPMFAKQVADQVTVQVMNGNAPVGDAISYSVMQYCNNRIKKSTNANEVAMCKGLLNYATAAQMYFNYNTSNLANASLSDADKRLEKPDLSAHKYSITGEEFGIKAKSATVTMESEIRIRVYFILTGSKSIEDYTFTIDGVAVQPRHNDKGWYIESQGIAAKHMEVMHDFCVGGITVRYSALSYVNSKLSSKDPLEVELAKALYAYYASAEAFLG